MTKQPEGKLSRKIIDAWLRMGAYAYKVHGSEYQPAGTPDISGAYRGWSVWCETKMPGNKPTLIQYKRMNDLKQAGALTVVSYNVEDAVQMLEHIRSGDHTYEHCQCLYVELYDLQEIIRTGQHARS